MIRALSAVRALSVLPQASITQQSVRWYPRKPRKPRWMGTAKSKLFRVPTRPQIPIEEEVELKRLYNHYRTAQKSISQFLTAKYSKDLLAPADTQLLKAAYEEDFVRCTEINDRWNAEVRVLREARVAEELNAAIEHAKNRKAELEAKNEQKLREADEIVRQEKAKVHTFITRETLDDVIEKAISNPIDYNFAIDLEGNKIIGRETRRESKESTQ